MDVRNCKCCGRLYNYVGGSYKNLCPDCINELEKKFETVKEYIEENKNAPINQVSNECDVSVKQIEQWVREERLSFSENSVIGISCELCGALIKSGRYCDNCKTSLANQLGSIYRASEKVGYQKKDKTAKMRFLE